MTEVRLTGVVTDVSDPFRDGDPFDDSARRGTIWIGDVDLVAAVGEASFPRHARVIVGIQDERYIGDLINDCGWGYSEFTPMDPDTLMVGPHDLLVILGRYEGQVVTVTISDEAIDVGPPAREIATRRTS